MGEGIGENRFESWQPLPPTPEESSQETEVYLSDAEVEFFKKFSTEVGYKKSLAVARLLNAPHENVEIAPERQSAARQRGKLEHREPRPELGGFEYHTASIMARTWQKSLEAAQQEGAVHGDVTIAALDHGQHRWFSLDEYLERRQEGTDEMKILATIASLDGDDPEGATILIRNDMDALQMASGEIKHQCGHNVHSGWAATNVDGLIAYKKQFGELPFKRAIFVSEANEEANPSAGELISPKELLEGGFEERYGKIDFALGAHVIASIPENAARVEVEGFHGATDFIFTVQPTKEYKAGEDADLRLLPLEVARLTNEQYRADQANERFGKRKLIADDGRSVPPVYVRVTASQEADPAQENAYANLALNSLVGAARYEGSFKNKSVKEDLLRSSAEAVLKPWQEQGFAITSETTVNDETGEFSLNVQTPGPAHVAFGGPNPQQLLGEMLQKVGHENEIIGTTPVSGIRFGGTMRLRTSDHQQVQKEVATTLQTLFQQAVQNLDLNDKVNVEFLTQNSVAPVMNDPDMTRQARAVFKKAGIGLTRVHLPHAGAESFAEYERFFGTRDKKMAYVLIGGMKRDKAKQLLQTEQPVDMSCIHHSDTFTVQDSAMPYGVVLDALAIQYARQWKKEQAGLSAKLDL